MAVRIVRLGSARAAGEGLRIGTVRRPPRGVPKSEFARGNWYDVWYPNLSPTVETMKLGQGAQSDADWHAFEKRFRADTIDTTLSLDGVSLDTVGKLAGTSTANVMRSFKPTR